MREYLDYLDDILEETQNIKDFIKGVSREDFLENRKTINAVIRSLEVIGEASKKIPDEIKAKNPAIPWREMAGMRDKLIHEYFGVDLDIVWVVASEEIPPLEEKIDKIIGS